LAQAPAQIPRNVAGAGSCSCRCHLVAMVVPLGGMGPEEVQEEVPDKIKDYHFCWWYMLFTLFMFVFVGCCVALKIFDALIALMIGIWAYWMVKERCQNMSQQCLFSFGLMCVMQAVMEAIILGMSLPGRRTTVTTPGKGGASNAQSPHGAPSPFMGGPAQSSSYTVTTVTTPFFHEEQGWHYNLQSAMMIANCVIFILAAIMAKVSYSEYPNSLFSDVGERQPMGGQSYGRGGYGGGQPQNSFGGGQRQGGGQPANSFSNNRQQTFGGQGQRLGSN